MLFSNGEVTSPSNGCALIFHLTEICGGPHTSRTGELVSFMILNMILKEEGSSSGVRRIKLQPVNLLFAYSYVVFYCGISLLKQSKPYTACSVIAFTKYDFRSRITLIYHICGITFQCISVVNITVKFRCRYNCSEY